MEKTATVRLPVLVLIGTTAISHAGNVLTTVAVPWFVLQTTGSAAKTGITAATVVVATIVAGIFGGTLVDRLGHARASVLSDLASGAAVAMIPLLHLTVGIQFWQLLGLMFLSAVLDVPGATVRQSLAPELAERAEYQLERVNSALSSATRAAQLVGPLVAGLLIAAFGAASVLWVNAATFALSALMVALAIPAHVTNASVESAPCNGYLTDMLEGFRFVRGDQLLLGLVVVAALLNFLSNPLTAVILPVYANEVFGSAAHLGLMLAAFGGGALVGTVLYGVVGHRVSRRGIFVGSFAFSIIPYGILATIPDVVVTVVSLLLIGVLMGPLTPLFMTVLQERTPAALRGRIFGLMTASVWIVLPVGMFVAGMLLEHVGLATTLRIQVVAFTVLSLAVVVLPVLRHLEGQ